MKRRTILMVGSFLLIGAILASLNPTPSLAQSGDDYELGWWTVDGGGGSSSGGSYSLWGTAGQPEGGRVSSGGDYRMTGGFWGGGALALASDQFQVYLPMVIR